MAVAKNIEALLILSILTLGECLGAAHNSNGRKDMAYGFHGDTSGVVKGEEMAMEKAVEYCSDVSQCRNTKCDGCTVKQCVNGVCGCGCPFEPQPPMQCPHPDDCINYCHGCPAGCLQGYCKCYC